MTLVTISAAYGAGGSRDRTGRRRRLGVPFLGRPAVPELFATTPRRTPVARAPRPAEACSPRSPRWPSPGARPRGSTAEELLPDQARRRELETEIRAFAEGGEGVILGRGAVVVLHDDPRVLHVLLDGTVEARTRRRWSSRTSTAPPRITGSCAWTASGAPSPGGHVRRPRARAGRLPPRARLSTVLALGECVELIAVAARAHAR
jgi:hypothetical protein